MVELIESLAEKYDLKPSSLLSVSPRAHLEKLRAGQIKQRKEEKERAYQELYDLARQRFIEEWAKRSTDIRQAIENRMPPAGYKRGGSLVVQLSDLHFGNRTITGSEVTFDMKIAAKRLMLYAERIKDLQIATGADKLYVCLTGDLIESRMGRDRQDKVANFDGAQTLAMLHAASVLIQFIDDLCSSGQFSDAFIHGVMGNEARLTHDVCYGHTTAYENYDCVLHGLLSNEFSSRERTTVKFGDFHQVLEIEELKILLMHGHTLKGQLSQQSQANVLSNHRCDFGMSGHIHFPVTQFNWSRSGCLGGSDDYAKNALNITDGRASQTVLHVCGKNRSVMQIDLQDPGELVGYNLPTFSGAFGSIEMQHSSYAA